MAQNENNFDLDGEIVHIGMPEPKTPTFTCQSIVLKLFAGAYSTEGKFTLVNKNLSLISGFAVGNRVQINFQIRDKKYIKKGGSADWFQNKEILNISKL